MNAGDCATPHAGGGDGAEAGNDANAFRHKIVFEAQKHGNFVVTLSRANQFMERRIHTPDLGYFGESFLSEKFCRPRRRQGSGEKLWRRAPAR
jgi:hypothetical protein